MKKITLFTGIALLMCCTALFAGGGGETQAAAGSSSDEKIVLSLGHGQGATSEPHQALLAYSAALKEQSGGKIELNVFPASQLGAERDLLEGLGLGTVEMAYISTGVMENFAPLYGLYSLPFIFGNYEHVEAVVNGPIGAEINKTMLDDKKVRVLTLLTQGFRYAWSNKPLKTVDSFQGVKMRVPESPSSIAIWRNLKANPTPIPWNEAYTALQTKVVDGCEVHVYSIIADKIDEVIKYCSTTGHMMSCSGVMISESVYQSMPADRQKLITGNIPLLWKKNYDLIVSNEPKSLQKLRDKGIEIFEFTPQQKLEMQAANKTMYDDFAAKFPKGKQYIDQAAALKK
jgi:tripartite ATP-independent transporter DctP family solute receptor